MADQELFDALNQLATIELGQILFSRRVETIKLWFVLNTRSDEQIRSCHRQLFPEAHPPQSSAVYCGHAYPYQSRYSSGVSSIASRPLSDASTQLTDPSRSSTGTNYSTQSFNRQSSGQSYNGYGKRIASIREDLDATAYNAQPHWNSNAPAQYDSDQFGGYNQQQQSQVGPSSYDRQVNYNIDDSAPGYPQQNGDYQTAIDDDQALALSQPSLQRNNAAASPFDPTAIPELPPSGIDFLLNSPPGQSYTESPAAMSPAIKQRSPQTTNSSRTKLTRRVRPAAESKHRPFFCPQCSREYLSKNALKDHVLAAHEQSHSYKCKYPYCTKVSFTVSEWNKHHTGSHHDCTTPDKTGCRDYTEDKTKQCWGCNLCKKLSFSLNDWAIHYEYHITQQKKSRTDCDYSFLIRSLLKQSSVQIQWEKYHEENRTSPDSDMYTWEQSTSLQLLHDLEYGVHNGIPLAQPGKAMELVKFAIELTGRVSKRPASETPSTLQRTIEEGDNRVLEDSSTTRDQPGIGSIREPPSDFI